MASQRTQVFISGHQKLAATLLRTARWSVGLSVLVAAVVLFGHFADIEVLARFVPEWPVARPAAALAILSTAVGFGLLQASRRRAGLALLAVTALGTLGAMLLPHAARLPGGSLPVYSGSVLLIIIVGMALVHFPGRRHLAAARALAMVSATLIFIAGIGISFRLLLALPPLVEVAFPTLFALLCLTYATAVVRSDALLIRLLTSPQPGAVMMRRLLPVVLLLPVVIGWIDVGAQGAGLFDHAFGTVVQVVFTVAALAAVMLWGARSLDRIDSRRSEAERQALAQREWLHVTISSCGEPVVATDAAGVVRLVNPAAEVLAGQSSYDLIGRGIAQAFPLAIDDASSIEHPVLNVLSGVRFADISREFKFAHGEHERYVEVTVAPINSGEGALLGAVMTMRDVSLRRDNERALRSAYAELDRRVAERTAALEQANAALSESLQERKRIEIEREQLLAIEQRLRRDAERANRAKDEFLAIVSHELRSPLNALRGWGFLLSSAKTPDASVIERATAAIKRNVDHQVRLIDDLLDTSRILSGKLNIERQSVNLIEVVQRALEVVRPAAVNKRITLDFHAPAPELMLEGDAARLQQIAVNLLANAIKFTPEEGQVKVVLEAKQSIARLAVIDTGAGIEPEFLPRVFDRFSQADTSTTRRHGGLGIGLALVRYLTEMHDGTVHAHSEGIGKGSTFIVELPLSSAVQPGVSVADHATPYAARLEGHVVWALDDDPDAREVIHLTLQQAGARVRSVTTGAELLTMLEARLPEERPDVLLLDLGMPKEDGFMVLSRIRALESLKNTGSQPRIPAIAVSAFTEISLECIIERGFSDFVSKPFNPNELVASIVHVTRFAAPETELQGSVAALLPEPGAR